MDISVRDLRMMYNHSLILWKGQPSFVAEISDSYRISLYDLGSQRYKTVKWNADNFAPPAVRIGYVNLGTNCAYIHRVPARLYKIGLSMENLEVIRQEHALSAIEEARIYDILRKLDSPHLYDALMGNYPDLREAAKMAQDNEGVVAFDKQFAVDYKGKVFFKGKEVGHYRFDNVEFKDEFKHLRKALISG